MVSGRRYDIRSMYEVNIQASRIALWRDMRTWMVRGRRVRAGMASWIVVERRLVMAVMVGVWWAEVERVVAMVIFQVLK